ncbi:Alpha/Beta hydrolase protein [Diplogelasinospora grovesii]|uniref:Alpha/Beta hydrolase protein n=1 Tax=Diplogelasinospora grovesii TaxID=303347 RepID=A0AAN6MYH2_9PEZI|nr:Alpha/Beta hydrolase protein [Diplogelasinospora grovesii]
MASTQDKIYGIKELYRPADGSSEFDIVAVHGLNGDACRTWTARVKKVCWLNDAEFLPKYVRNARVLTWGYNASFSSLTGDRPSKDRIHQHAHTLVANLAADRQLAGTADQPIIFLCHSLGGIVVKRALSYAQTRTGHKLSREFSIFTCTYGILFFGTPHHGSSKASWLAYLKKAGSIITPTSRGMKKSDLVSALEQESETLQNITDYFVPLMRHFRIYFFWEQEPTDLGLFGKDLIVTQDSAAPRHDDTERAGIAANHSGMVKFEDPSSPGFLMVVDALLRYCASAPDAIRLRRAEAVEALDRERRREAAEAVAACW